MIRKIINKDKIDKSQTFVQINSPGFKQPGYISLELFGELISKPNINLLEFANQDSSVNIKDGKLSPNHLELTMDDNYIYIWVKDKWKRIALLDY